MCFFEFARLGIMKHSEIKQSADTPCSVLFGLPDRIYEPIFAPKYSCIYNFISAKKQILRICEARHCEA